LLNCYIMIKNKNIICFAGEDWWYHNPHSVHHIMKQFSKYNKVMFVNSLGIRFPSLKESSTFIRLFNKLKSLSRWAKWAQMNLLILSPIIVPLYKYNVIRKINKYVLLFQIKLAMKLFRFRDPILYIILPTAADVIGHLGEQAVIYHCVDKFGAYDGVPDAIRDMEQQLIKKADLILYPNRKLFEERRALSTRSRHFSHGVDYEHFALAMNGKKTVPADIKDIKGPVIGYFGAIEYFIDQELLAYIAEKEPDWSFVFIGKVNVDVSRLEKFKNIHFLGKKNYDDLPAYAKAFDVCIIPRITDHDFESHRSPIKLREYLSTGRPVVSVSFTEVNDLDDIVYVAADKVEFHQKLQIAVNEKDERKRNQRLARVKNETWESRAEKISALIVESSNKTIENIPTELEENIA